MDRGFPIPRSENSLHKKQQFSFLHGRNVTVDFFLDIQRPGLCPRRKSGSHWYSLVQSAVLETRYTAICRVFYMYSSAGTLIIHYYHHVRYAIPQHSSLVSDNYSNNSSEWTARQEAESIVSRFVSSDASPLSARSLSLVLLRPWPQ